MPTLPVRRLLPTAGSTGPRPGADDASTQRHSAPRRSNEHQPAQRPLSQRRALLTVSLAAASWGSAGAAAAVLHRISGLGPITVSCWRFALGALLLLAARPFVRRAAGTVANRPRLLVTVGTGLLMATFQTCYLASVDLAGLALGTTATLGAAPVLTALGARALFGERLGRRGAATIVLALTGLTLLATSGGPTATGPEPLWGLLCALGSAAGSAAINLLSQAQARNGTAGSPYDRALTGFAVGAVCLLPLAAWTGPLLPGPQHLPAAVALLGYLGAVPTALAYALFFAALGVVRATSVSVVMMLEPVAALVPAVGLLGEHLTLAAACGTVTLLAAVSLLDRAR